MNRYVTPDKKPQDLREVKDLKKSTEKAQKQLKKVNKILNDIVNGKKI